MCKNTKINAILCTFSIACIAVLFLMGAQHALYAQIMLEAEPLAVNELIAAFPPITGKIVHAGAVQIGRTHDDVCFFNVKADTFLTIVNPAERLLVTCSDVPTDRFEITGRVTLYNSEGMYMAATTFTVPPKGNRTISLAKLLLSNDQDTDNSLRKYTYDIVWYVPKLVAYLEEVGCRVPFIPISVEVKEVIFKDWLCDSSLKAEQEMLLTQSAASRVMTMSETILDKSNIVYPLLSAQEVSGADTSSVETKPEPAPAIFTETQTPTLLGISQKTSPASPFLPAVQFTAPTLGQSQEPVNTQPFNFLFR
ncbi:MAG: hypothetical protein ACMUJM_19710 [bacterium]